MQQGGPIVYAYAVADGYIWANYFLGDVADAIWWAHCICACGCRSLLLGPLMFWEGLCKTVYVAMRFSMCIGSLRNERKYD